MNAPFSPVPLLSAFERQQMLGDIARVSLLLARDLTGEPLGDLDVASATHPAEVCPRERLAFLQTEWGTVARLLRRIENAPPPATRTAEREVAFEQARRVSAPALLCALRGGVANLQPAPRTSSLLATKLNGQVPRRIAQTQTVPHFDTGANRFVVATLRAWQRDLQTIVALAEVVGVQAVAEQARQLCGEIGAVLARDPWKTIPVGHGQSLPVLFGFHRAIFGVWQRYRRGFALNWSNPVFHLPARETWQVYEIWCLFQVAQALHDLGYMPQQATNGGNGEAWGFALTRSGLTFSLVRGRASGLRFSHPSGEAVTLWYNRAFTFASDRDGWRSRSHLMRPDICLQTERGLFVFDAKYKAYMSSSGSDRDEDGPESLPFVADTNQMHAYRDGIRNERQNTPVGAAWLLYAGQLNGFNTPVIAYPPASESYPFGQGEIGAVLLRPGTVSPLPALLTHLQVAPP